MYNQGLIEALGIIRDGVGFTRVYSNIIYRLHVQTYYYYYYLWSDLLFALALGPQFASGFSGNRVNFSNLEGGLASLRIAKEALILKE